MLIKLHEYHWASSKAKSVWLNPAWIKKIEPANGQGSSVVTLVGDPGGGDYTLTIDEDPDLIAQLIKNWGAQ